MTTFMIGIYWVYVLAVLILQYRSYKVCFALHFFYDRITVEL